jgi:hypothetical protein
MKIRAERQPCPTADVQSDRRQRCLPAAIGQEPDYLDEPTAIERVPPATRWHYLRVLISTASITMTK